MDKDMAIQRIIELVQQLSPEVNANQLEFFATKLVLDVLDYCNREDFPEALCYAAAGALVNQFSASADSAAVGGNAPLKAIKQDDVEFTFSVAEKDTSLDDGALMFNALKPRLNLYRKVKAL